jgi:hypothetical protein
MQLLREAFRPGTNREALAFGFGVLVGMLLMHLV